MEKFRLINLKIVHHHNEICNVDFVDVDYFNRNKPLTTVLIGANGSGKTYLLKLIADVFNFLNDLHKKPKFRYEYFYVTYFIHGYTYTVEVNKNTVITCKRNNQEIPFYQIILPQKVLAVSFMINDKFLFNDNIEDSMYKYLGVRKTSNSTYTSSLVRSVINNVLYSIEKEKTGIICDALNLMKMKYKISFEIKVASKKVSESLINDNSINLLLDEKIGKLTINEFNKIFKLKNKLIDAIKKISIGNITIDMGSKDILMNTVNYNDLLSLLEYKKEIDLLIDLHILKPISIYFYKKNEKISFEDCSSGEKHIIFAFTSIAVNISKDSIILIDEPEISLHPNWQMQYIHLLKNTFIEYKSCHFILATHSHYIISDLESGSSSLVIIKRDDDNEVQEAELVKYDTYAWSAENIIYNVFGLRTTRNYYFEMDLRELFESMQSVNGDKEKVKRLYNKLSKYTYDKNDPLNKVLEEVEVYLNVSGTNDNKD